ESWTSSGSIPRGGTLFVGLPDRVKLLVWQGQRKPLPSAVRLTAQPRCGHSVVNATTSASAPSGCRTSQTEPIGSGGYFTQASCRSAITAYDRGSPTFSSLSLASR